MRPWLELYELWHSLVETNSRSCRYQTETKSKKSDIMARPTAPRWWFTAVPASPTENNGPVIQPEHKLMNITEHISYTEL